MPSCSTRACWTASPAVGRSLAGADLRLGMPRSGSTLIEQILASHPQVHAAGELKNLDRVVEAVSDASGRPVPFPQCISALDADGFRRLGQAYLASLPTLPAGKTRITDKMPGNFLYVGLIRLILPNARIIHTMRDPVDTCVSCFSRLFTYGQPFSYDLAELGRYYRWYHELMEHWRSVLPAGAMLDVAYEDVVDNLEEQARRLIDYCGLPWDDRCLSFHETSRPIAHRQQRSGPPAAVPQLAGTLAPLRSVSPAAAGRARSCREERRRAARQASERSLVLAAPMCRCLAPVARLERGKN